MSNEFTNDYDIGYDLEKWSGTGTEKPQVYTMLNGLKYAFNALPAENIINLPIGIYTKNAGDLTFKVTSNNSGISNLWLTDNTTGFNTDLLVSDYSFYSNSGSDDSRFGLFAQHTPTQNVNTFYENGPLIHFKDGGLFIQNLPKSCHIRIYDACGRILAHKSNDESSLEIPFSKKGFYTIKINSEFENWTIKRINQ